MLYSVTQNYKKNTCTDNTEVCSKTWS